MQRRWQAKLRGLEAFLRSPLYEQRFAVGPHTVGVLIVTTSAARLAQLKALSEQTSPAGFFLFTTFAQATPEHILRGPIWQITRRQGLFPLLRDAAAGA